MEFGEKLREAREANGITQQTLADQLYVTRQAVSRWECGSRFPDLLTAKKAAEILEVSLDDLLSGEKSQKFLEGNPIITSSKASTIQAWLYGLSSTCYIVFSVLWITAFIFDSGQYDLQILPMVIVKSFHDFSMAILMISGFLLSVKEKATPGNMAVLPVLYSIFKILEIITTNYFHFDYHNVDVEAIIVALIKISFYIINAIAVINYFLKDIKKCRYFIYGSYGLITLERIFVFSQELLWEIIQFETISMDNFIMDILSLLGNLIFCGLIIYQTYALHKKRCLAART